MVIGHVIEQGWKRDIIYSFHMPFFIIISGFFYKDKTFKENIKNIFLKLILPYVICTFFVDIYFCKNIQSVIPMLLVWGKQIIFSYSFWGKINFSPNAIRLSALWFFPLLAFIRLIFILLKKISKDNPIQLIFLCAITSFLGYLLGLKEYWLPFSFDVAMFGIIFYYIGYILKKENLLEKILSDYKVLILILIIWILGIKYNCVDIAFRKYSNGAFSILTAVCGTITILKISQLIEKYLKVVGDVLAWYGKNSMNVLMLHFAEMSIIRYSFIATTRTILKIKLIASKILLITIGTSIINCIQEMMNILKNKKKLKEQ